MARRSADNADGVPKISVADLLREAGIDESRPRRHRRKLDDADSPVELPAAIEPEPEPDPDPEPDPEPEPEPEPVRGPSPEPEPEHSPEPETEPEPDNDREAPEDRALADAHDDGDSIDSTGVVSDNPSGESAATHRRAESAPEQARRQREHSGAVHWALAVGEVLLAVVIGVGLSYVFRLMWDIAPYGAAILAPVVICAVVGIVGFSRKKMGLGAIPLTLLLLVLFVTSLLVVLPAAWVLTAT